MPGRSVHIQTKAPLSLWLQAYPGSRICQAPPVRQVGLFQMKKSSVCRKLHNEYYPIPNLVETFILCLFLLSHLLADHMMLGYLLWAFSSWSHDLILFYLSLFALGPLLWGSSNSPFVEPFAPSREGLFIFLLSLLWLDTYFHMTSWNYCEIYLEYGMQASISHLYFRCD